MGNDELQGKIDELEIALAAEKKSKLEKHLEFIQGVINRHNTNSFMLKGWTITITAALYALAGTVKEPNIVLIALAPIILFWGLDAFYLSNERCFVDHYNAVATGSFKLPKRRSCKAIRNKTPVKYESGTIPEFDMNFNRFKVFKKNRWLYVIKSKTICWFYFPMVLITFAVMTLFMNLNQQDSKTIDVNATLKSNGLKIELKNNAESIHIDDTLKINIVPTQQN